MNDKDKSSLISALSTISAILIWQIVAVIIKEPLLFCSPIETLFALCSLLRQTQFILSAINSIGRILSGFLISFTLSFFTALISSKYRYFKLFIQPYASAIRSIPVISVVIILLIYTAPSNLPLITPLIISFPLLYLNLIEGLSSIDKKMIEICQIFEIKKIRKIRFVYLPHLKPFIDSGVRNAIGLSWKSGIAAEVLSLVANSIGEWLYQSKIYFETSSVFALTFFVVLLSATCSKIFDLFMKVIYSFKTDDVINTKTTTNKINIEKFDDIIISNLTKKFGSLKVFDNYNCRLYANEINYINYPSGYGKTTLLNLIMGNKKIDSGTITNNHQRLSVCFQENRLCEQLSALENVLLAYNGTKDKNEKIIKEAKELLKDLEISEPDKKARDFSGGQQRRISVARALFRNAELYIFDEPLAGLDKTSSEKVMTVIKRKTANKTVIITGH